ncbi:MAG: hypothetical protein RLN76_02705 [Phycisphaeraceae bacterium]
MGLMMLMAQVGGPVGPSRQDAIDPGRLANVELQAVSDAITGNYAYSAWWLVVLLSLVTVALAVAVTRKAWLAWRDRVMAAWLFWRVARDCGLSRREIVSLWRAGRERPVEVRLAMLLSCGALRKFGGPDARACEGRLFGEPDGRMAA